MSRPALNLTFLTLAFIFVTAEARSQTAPGAQNCADRGTVIERLASRYGESRQSIGLGARNQVMEVFASTETGTWTITVTRPDGITCLIASGQSFETLHEVAPKGAKL